MAQTNKRGVDWWIRLKRFLRRVKVPPMSGDGGLFSDKAIIITKPQTDSTSVLKDSVVTKPIKK